MFQFDHPRARRKPALTPLIDVVFLLLVFFMLAAQFGRDGALSLSGTGGAADYTGPPRLITIQTEGVMINGVATSEEDVMPKLSELTKDMDDAIVLRASSAVDVQRLTDIATLLTEAGFTRLVLSE
jgi:biopolymer transport protein ExbD